MVDTKILSWVVFACLCTSTVARPDGPAYPLVPITLEDKSNHSMCTLVVAIYEIYNATSDIVKYIDESTYNFTLWSGGLATLKHDDDEPKKRDGNRNGHHNKPSPKLDITHPPEVLGLGVPLEIEKDFVVNLTRIGASVMDMNNKLCIHTLDKTNSKSAGNHLKSTSTTTSTPSTTRKPPEFPHNLTLTSHITSVQIPNVFYHILIVSQDSKHSSSTKALSSSNSLFSYYISQTEDGRLRVEHGAISPAKTSIWTWLPVCVNSSNCSTFHLVSQAHPNCTVGLGSEGDLQIIHANQTPKLNFTLNFNKTLGYFHILSTINNETFCLVQFFASTLRLMPLEATKTIIDRELCTGFHLQLGEVSVYSADSNTTYIDLYESKSERTVEDIIGPEGHATVEITSTSSAILYYLSDPSELGLFLKWESPTTPLQELYALADSYFEPGTTCSDNYDHVHPILTCILSIETRKVANSSIETHAGATGHSRAIPLTDSKVKLFRHFVKFKFIAEGLQVCGNEGTARCHSDRIHLSLESVRELLDEKEIAYPKITEDGSGLLFYWNEGVMTLANTTMITTAGVSQQHSDSTRTTDSSYHKK